jgi:non-ribosomal peptide synthetase component F
MYMYLTSKQDPQPIHQAFHDTALSTPNAQALIDATTGTVLTYKQVQHRVLSLAKELRDAGCDRDRVVAIFMDPSPNYVVGMLAALSAGGAVSIETAIGSTFFLHL